MSITGQRPVPVKKTSVHPSFRRRTGRLYFVLGDIHFPFHSKKLLKKVIGLAKSDRPDAIVQIGDLYDNFSFSKYARSHDVVKPLDEIADARKYAEDMWGDLADTGAKCYQLHGNHDDRLAKRVLEKFPEAESLFADRLIFPRVRTTADEREELFLEGLCFMHGFRSKLGDHARFNQQSTVCGHSHVGGTVFYRNRNGVYFELNAGWMGDESAPVFSYANQKVITGWTSGYARIENGAPSFIPIAGR